MTDPQKKGDSDSGPLAYDINCEGNNKLKYLLLQFKDWSKIMNFLTNIPNTRSIFLR
jgi:hypothetical protein